MIRPFIKLFSFFYLIVQTHIAVCSEIEPFDAGLYSVASTNMQIADKYHDIGDEEMHAYLLGLDNEKAEPQYIDQLLKYPEAAWIVNVPIPTEPEVYGPASGVTLPVLAYITYPSAIVEAKKEYAFPYFNADFGIYEHMLGIDESPQFADPDKQYPLIILSHGSGAHGIYDIAHANLLASHGYIVVVPIYGDIRTAAPYDKNQHVEYLRPLLTKSVLDSVLQSKQFGSNIDINNIGLSGYSFGGFTGLAVAGGLIQDDSRSVTDPRISAVVAAAPWVGGYYKDEAIYSFGENNHSLEAVSIPIMSLYGSKDEVTLASFILPAIKKLSGPTYVIELVDQPHVFEEGSWLDRNNWELLFFSAYLKHNAASLNTLQKGRSMKGGNQDIQHFEYQKLLR